MSEGNGDVARRGVPGNITLTILCPEGETSKWEYVGTIRV